LGFSTPRGPSGPRNHQIPMPAAQARQRHWFFLFQYMPLNRRRAPQKMRRHGILRSQHTRAWGGGGAFSSFLVPPLRASFRSFPLEKAAAALVGYYFALPAAPPVLPRFSPAAPCFAPVPLASATPGWPPWRHRRLYPTRRTVDCWPLRTVDRLARVEAPTFVGSGVSGEPRAWMGAAASAGSIEYKEQGSRCREAPWKMKSCPPPPC